MSNSEWDEVALIWFLGSRHTINAVLKKLIKEMERIAEEDGVQLVSYESFLAWLKSKRLPQ